MFTALGESVTRLSRLRVTDSPRAGLIVILIAHA